MSNPNFSPIHKLLLAPAAALALGPYITGCTSQEDPNPAPTSASAPSTTQETDGPKCKSVTARPNPQNVLQVGFEVATEGIDDKIYSIGSVRTEYGDGTADLYRSHEYTKYGPYLVRATVILDANEAAGAKLPDGTELRCQEINIDLIPPPQQT